MSKNRIYVISPIALVALSACRGTFDSAGTPVTGNIVKGPLSNALVFLDLDGDNVLDANEQSIRTDANGKFTINTNATNYKIVALTDDSTVDTSSGAILSGVTLSAPKGAAVVTPTTTLMEEGGLSASEVAEVLGLPDGVDPLTFNPFEAGVDAATALAVEKVSQQLMTAVSSFASAAEGAGASEKGAFEAALKSVVDVVKTKAAKAKDPNAAAADKKIDFTKADDLELIKAQVTTKAAALDGIDMTTMNAIANDTRDAIKNVNDKVATVTDLKSDTTKNIFSTTQVLKDQVKNASVDKKAGKVANIAFKSKAEVDTQAKNKAPQDIKLTGDGIISENASSLVIGTVSTVDSDQDSGIAFKYKLAGEDADFFSLDETTGKLSLKRKPDYETKASYEVTIITEDSGGKKYSETFKISVVKAKAGEIYESSNAGNTTFLIADGTSSGKFDVIPVKLKSDRSGYEFDASNKTEAAYDVTADKLSESIGREPTLKDVASNSDASAAEAAAKIALTPSVVITAFNENSFRTSVADGATSKDGTLYLKFTLSDSSSDFTKDDITVTGGKLDKFTAVEGTRGTEYTVEFTPTGSSKVDTTINVAKDKFTNDYFGNTAAIEFNWTYDPNSSGWKAGEVYENSNNTTFLIIEGVTSGKFGAIPVKVKSGGSGYEFDTSKKTESSFDVAADELSKSIERMTKKADASSSDTTTAVAAAKTALSPSVIIEAFKGDSGFYTENAVADGATTNDSKLTLKFTVSDRSSGFEEGDITVTGGKLVENSFKAHTKLANTWIAEFTPTGSSKVDTTINIAKDKFTDQLLGLGNKATTEFNWTFDPDNGLKDGDIVKEVDNNGDATGKLLLLDIESTDTPTKYTLVPVKKDGSNWVYESDNAASKAGGFGLSDEYLEREIGTNPTGTGDSISDSAALTILKAAGVMVSIHGDEKGGSKAFSAGTYDASESRSPDSDGIGWILKGVKAFGETTTAKASPANRPDVDFFKLIDSPTSSDLTSGQKYKVTVVKEAWDGSDNGKLIDFFKVVKGTTSTDTVLDSNSEFTADDSSDYFLQIVGKSGEDAQYSVFLDIV